eukprot:1990699-Prymnesium_polylepis.2
MSAGCSTRNSALALAAARSSVKKPHIALWPLRYSAVVCLPMRAAAAARAACPTGCPRRVPRVVHPAHDLLDVPLESVWRRQVLADRVVYQVDGLPFPPSAVQARVEALPIWSVPFSAVEEHVSARPPSFRRGRVRARQAAARSQVAFVERAGWEPVRLLLRMRVVFAARFRRCRTREELRAHGSSCGRGGRVCLRAHKQFVWA